jgi:hypothetical protein
MTTETRLPRTPSAKDAHTNSPLKAAAGNLTWRRAEI